MKPRPNASFARGVISLLRSLTFAASALLASALLAHTPTGSPPDRDDGSSVPAAAARDPLERFNRRVFRLNECVTTNVLRPLNRGYEYVVPAAARRCTANAFRNVRYPSRAVGALLQGKLHRASQETGKFVVNSVVGVGGLFQPAERIAALAKVPAEDIGQALGAWGLPAGPFLVLPLIGPSSPREFLGRLGDFALTPTNWDALGVGNREWIASDYRFPIATLGFFSDLPDMLREYGAVTAHAVDPYTAARDAYLQYRKSELAR